MVEQRTHCEVSTGLESPEDALVIRNPWAEMVVQGEKEWELRQTKTSKRTRICIALSGSKTIIGEADLHDCIEINRESLQSNFSKHKVMDCDLESVLKPDAPIFAWVMKNPFAYTMPKPYAHPTGAVIWVRLQHNKVPRRSMTLTVILLLTLMQDTCY